MTSSFPIQQPLNDVQLMLLRLFSRPVAPNDLEAIRKLLLEYYHQALQDELDRVIEEKKITREDFEIILNRQQRTKTK